MKFIEKLYRSLPVTLQNTAVSARGYRLASRRYGRIYAEFSEFLKQSESWSAKQFEKYQLEALNQLLVEARQGSAYYRELLTDIEFKNLEQYCAIPILEKQVLRTQTQRVANLEHCHSGDEVCNTSGTSGTPITFTYDKASMQRNMALRDRQYRWAGVDRSDRSCRFSGRVLLGNKDRAPFWRYNAAERQLFFSVFHMQESNLSEYIKAISDFKPVYLDGYPSALYVLAKYLLTARWSPAIRPRAIITTAETLMDYQRVAIEEAFQCPVFSFYSSSEGAPFVIQCDKGGHHLCPESGIVEILNEDGSPAAGGESGEMIITSFFQRSLPLVRYRIGDIASYTEQPCSCGSQMPTMTPVSGRMDDVVFSPERGPIGRLDPIFKGMPPTIQLAQVAQTDVNTLELRYLPDADFKPSDLQPVIENLRHRVGSKMIITTLQLTEHPKGNRGKFRAVVREYDASAKLGESDRQAALCRS